MALTTGFSHSASYDRCMKPSPDVLWQELSGESVLLDLKSEEYFGLNEVGTRVWQLLASGLDSDQIVRQIECEFLVDIETARRDVAALLADLRRAGLIVAS